MSVKDLESYPPNFRLFAKAPPQQTTESLLKQSSDTDDVVSDPIPRIDFQGLVDGDQNDMAKLREACRDWGVFRLVNHGIPRTFLTQLEDRAREMFSISFESKNEIFSASPLSYFWGTPALSPSGTAQSTGLQNINLVEGLNVPLSQLSRFQSHLEQQQQKQFPTNSLASFRLVLEEYGKRLGRLATAIFGAMSEKIDISTVNSKSNYLSESTGLLRIYRYPRFSGNSDDDDQQSWGMEVHTDSSVLSILNQDQVGGLEVFKDDQWFNVKPISNTLIVNLGDMMQAISDDKYKSVKHRVRINKRQERVSICYFVFPSEGSEIRSSKYRPFTYSDFQAQVQRDIKTLGYKVGLERFELSSTYNAPEKCP